MASYQAKLNVNRPVLVTLAQNQCSAKSGIFVFLTLGMTQSMSRKGNCLENVVMDSVFGMLKSECFYLNPFSSLNEQREAIEDYIHNERISLK